MTEPNAVNKPRPMRKLAELTSEFMADAFRKQGFAASELVTRWKDIVGTEIAAHAEPVKLQWPREVNGEPGALYLDGQQRLIAVVALDTAGGQITAISSIVNPDKLRHLGPVGDLGSLLKPPRP